MILRSFLPFQSIVAQRVTLLDPISLLDSTGVGKLIKARLLEVKDEEEGNVIK